MNGTAPTASGTGTARVTDVGEYAARVRAALAGMAPDQIEDLTDGLEADLADALADDLPREPGTDDLVARFGTPEDYARELRVAAGLPEPAAAPVARGGPRAAWDRMTRPLRRAGAQFMRSLRVQPWWPEVRGFALAVRPIWWLVRAWAVYQLLIEVMTSRSIDGGRGWIPEDMISLVTFTVLFVVSVQWGRGRWRPGLLRWVPRAMTAVALLAVVPAAGWADAGAREVLYYDKPVYVEGEPRPWQEDGVWVDRMQVSNLFVYDAAGQPLDDVQIYDDRGRPVRTTTDNGWGSWELPNVSEPWTFVPATDEDGRRLWNVYPLLGAPWDDFDWESPEAEQPEDMLTTEPRRPPRPFAQAPALVDRAPETKDHGPSSTPRSAPDGVESSAP